MFHITFQSHAVAYSTNNMMYLYVCLSLSFWTYFPSLRHTHSRLPTRSLGSLFLYSPSHSGASPALSLSPHRCHCNGEPAVCNDRSPSCFWSPDTTTSQTTMKTSSSSFSSFPAHFRCQIRRSVFKIDIVSTIFVITNKYCIAFTLYKLV